MGERAKRGCSVGRWLLLVRWAAGEGEGWVQGDVCVEERDGRRNGGPGTAVDSRHRPVVDEPGRAARAQCGAEHGRLDADERAPTTVPVG
jgi:hypothetical protein